MPVLRRHEQQALVLEAVVDVGADLVVGAAGGDLAGDLVADVLRRVGLRVEDALAAAHRALDRLGDGVDPLGVACGRRWPGWRRW